MSNNEKDSNHKETASHNHHGHVHSHVDYHKEASGNLSFALVLNLLFNIVVIGGGILTNSVLRGFHRRMNQTLSAMDIKDFQSLEH